MHFIGILGSGCYPLARLLRSRGYTVTGSDSAVTSGYIDDLGIAISRGGVLPRHTALAVYSLAIDENDPEILSARSLAIPLISRAQLLGALMSPYGTRISVSGSHGKSTTTAVIDHILSTAAIPHTAVSGALLADGSPYTDGGGDVFVAEACEYKDSFLCLSPTHQIITSVQLDHTDYFSSLEAVRASFLLAARRAEIVVINVDDTVAADVARELLRDEEYALQKARKSDTPPDISANETAKQPRRIITYGYALDADYRIRRLSKDGEYTVFTLTHGNSTTKLYTPLIGDFNLYNLAAAAVLADALGVEGETIARAVRDFRGIDRRLSVIAHLGSTPIYYDYAHHPSELSAVITAIRERHGTVTVIFRPHTYSRTVSLWREFISALGIAQKVILLDIYPAREEAIDGVESRRLAEEIDGAIYSPDFVQAARIAAEQGTDAIALLGAGDVEAVRSELLRLAKNTG